MRRPIRNWQPYEDDFLKANGTKTARELGVCLNRSAGSVSNRLNILRNGKAVDWVCSEDTLEIGVWYSVAERLPPYQVWIKFESIDGTFKRLRTGSYRWDFSKTESVFLDQTDISFNKYQVCAAKYGRQ